MAAGNAPNVGVDFLTIHAVITRGLEVATEHGLSFAQDGYPDASRREGFLAYVGTLLSVLDAHHLTEDELAFPYFQDKLPDAPYDLLFAQHRELEPLLLKARAALGDVAGELPAGESLGRLNGALKGIVDLWHPHIGIEQEHFTVERLRDLIPPEEHMRLGKRFMEHSQQHARPDYLVVPFLLYNLLPDKRPVFADRMPPIVTQQLLPVVWKEKWQAMLPFLLS